MGYLASLLQCGHTHRKRKKTYQTVELKTRMDCDGCELKVKKALSYMKGVQSVEINRKLNKVTVNGYVEPNKVLKRVQSTGKKAEIWPYVPYNLVVQPYVAGTYDKRAPPGYVRNLEVITAHSQNRQEEQLVNLFSDDNPNACSVILPTIESSTTEPRLSRATPRRRQSQKMATISIKQKPSDAYGSFSELKGEEQLKCRCLNVQT